MATTATATLNGGPRGGLHATTLIHSEESQQDETCRVDSNSSFDSGHEDATAMPPLGLEDVSGWSGYKSSFYLDNQLSSMEASTGNKKRRKQSRPVRIPASEHMDNPRGAPGQPGLPPSHPQTFPHSDHSKVRAGPHPDLEECDNVGSEEEDEEESKHEDDNSLPPSKHAKSRRQVPLNLSSKTQGDDSSTDFDPSAGAGHLESISSSSHLTQLQLNSLMDNDKTELPGQGTKDSNRNSNPSFSPGLFPLISSSPFFSFFPQGQQSGHLSQQSGHLGQQQHLPNYQQLAASTTPNPPSGTPSSSSSVGSSHPNPHHHNNNSLSSNNNLAPGNLSNIPPQRIFNPEAYCDLCNKEFCNKYFLKTHKANKHGVYSETPTASSLPPSQVMAAAAAALSISSSPSTPFLSTSASSLLVPSTQAPSASGQQLQPSTSMSFNLKSSAPDTSVLSKSLALSLEAKGSGSNSNGSGARESFCDLCQKEFCNKYFLKRHKAKIHGIPMDSNGGGRSSKSLQPNRQNFANGLSDTGLPLMMGSDLESLGLELVAKHMEEAGGIEEGEVGRRAEGMEAGQLSHDTGGKDGDEEMREDQEGPSPFKLSSLQQLKLPLGLPQLGNVGTNENTCQFCFREFSSKALLRSHMTKKHRLLLPTFPPFLLPFQGIGTGLFEENAAEAGGDSVENFYSAEAMQNKEEVDYECNQCGRSFQTVYLLRMHKSYFHPESDEMSDITAAAAAAVTKMEESSDVESGKNTPNPPGDHDNNKAKGEEEEPETEGTSDSDDLRRLQTMIMELNRVSSAAASSSWSPPPECPPSASPANAGPSSNSASVCHICSKEFYSGYFLQQHIQHFHSNPDVIKTESSDVSSKTPLFDSPKKMSEIFDGSKAKVSDLFDSSKKMNELFENSSSSPGGKDKITKDSLGGLEVGGLSLPPGSSSFLTPGPKSSSASSLKTEASGKRPSPSLSRSYCTICHKELCNKYFMRTHMLKMHGISIESSTGLGGVTCDICNKELCSKYFLKVHKQNTHGIVEDGPSPPNPSTPGPIGLPLVSSAPPEPSVSITTTQADLVPLLASNPVEVQNRYFCHYSEVCPFCGRRFRSAKWLKTHLMSDHGQEGKDKWKSIEKSLQQQHHPRRQSKSSTGLSVSSSSRSSQKPGKSGQGKQVSGGSIPASSNGSNGNKCALCGYQTQDVEVMKVHLIKEHASQLTGAEGGSGALQYQDPSRVVLDPLTLLFQKMEGGTNKLYRCAYCPFTTSLLVYLYAHERTHTGLANSMTPQPAQSTSSAAPSEPSNTFQCPMCFHTFHHLETFQQHLIGHQMSGVLAPFFTPATSSSGGGRMSFESPPSGEIPTFPALSLLNGNTPESLYLSLKSAEQEEDERDRDDRGRGEEDDRDRTEEYDRDRDNTGERGKAEGGKRYQGGGAPEAMSTNVSTSMELKDRVRSRSEDQEFFKMRRKSRKVKSYRCSYCDGSFRSRQDCLSHIQQTHSRKRSSYFRCRKCKFQCNQYQKLLVHNRVHHSLFKHSGRGGGGGMRCIKLRDSNSVTMVGRNEWMSVEGLPQGRGVPQEGVLGDYLMQGFLLSCSSDEGREDKPARAGPDVTSTEDQVVDEPLSHNNNHNCANKYQSGLFVPSLVYLPVREKVSQSVRVSFSLTPTS
ncbi:unnamed protein product [Allacma fusca]|uniref:C2H2-type domain-containing protein n=1 Tax=Allacma fusca TaxID=39272 RepID=A0A8J2P047_9HEXA|nr:unnamed protein product [Allacma fusca]